jgi:hypothetical protein
VDDLSPLLGGPHPPALRVLNVIENDEITLSVLHPTKYGRSKNISMRMKSTVGSVGLDADLDPQASMRIKIRQKKADPDPHHWHLSSAKFSV